MGLFGKIKSNLSHGGVKVELQAPSSATANQVIPVTVTVTADSPQTINSVRAEIQAQAREQGFISGGGNLNVGVNNGPGVQNSRSSYETIAQVENHDKFTLSPGETKTVALQLYINGPTGAANPAGAAGGFMGALANLAQNFDHVNYVYRVSVSADVEGISLNPGKDQTIQILPPSATPPAATPPIAPTAPAPLTTPTPPSVPGQPPTATGGTMGQ